MLISVINTPFVWSLKIVLTPESVPGFYLDQMSGFTRHWEITWEENMSKEYIFQCGGVESQEQLFLIFPEEFSSGNNILPTLLN
jgi:hypothetical protein